MTENRGQKTPGVEGEVWDTPEKKAQASERIGRWHGYRPRPLRRLDIPKKNGQQRPLSIPAMSDRARPAVSLQAWQPIAETTADPHAYGFRPKRQCAEAIDQCFQVLRQKRSATWILDGEIEGLFDHSRLSWLDTQIPMHTRLWSKWRRRGVRDHGRRFPTTSGVPPGGVLAPVLSHLGFDGREAHVHGRAWQRRVYHIHDIRWADDCIVTANTREVLAQTVRLRLDALLADRGVRLSPTTTVMTPRPQSFDVLGQTIRQAPRRTGKPAKRPIPPSRASCQAVNAKINALWKQARTPQARIETLHPVRRGWANDHRHVSCGETFATLDDCVWRRT